MPAMILGLGFIAGVYPALYLSRFAAAVILTAGAVGRPAKTRLRWILVSMQFFIASALIICTLVVLKQVRYSETVDLGYERAGKI